MLTAQLLEEIADRVAALPLNGDLPSLLRSHWPALRFTCCHEDDLTTSQPPILTHTAFCLYLAGGNSHCIEITQDLAQAAVVIIAERSQDLAE
jgi:hypothetical protein